MKIGKRLMAWLMFGALVLADVNLPAHVTKVQAAEVYMSGEWAGDENSTVAYEMTLNEDGSTYTLHFSGTGAMKSISSYYSLPWYREITSITNVIFDEGITNIGDHCCESLHIAGDVIVPETVTSIGERAFVGAYMKKVVLPDSVSSIGKEAFYLCTYLEEINVPTQVTVIPQSAFENCEKLEKLVIPTGVTKIDNRAFDDCFALQEITIPCSVKTIGSGIFGRVTGTVNVVEGSAIDTYLATNYPELPVSRSLSHDFTVASGVEACTYCGKQISHNFVAQINWDLPDQLVSEATCTEGGVYKKYCSDCLMYSDETFSIDPPGHQYVEYINPDIEGQLISAPTCADEGYYYSYCYVCGALGEPFSVPSAEHVYKLDHTQWNEETHECIFYLACIYNENEIVRFPETAQADSVKIEPTCVSKGTTTYKAETSYSGQTYTDTKDIQDIEATGIHSYVSVVNPELEDQLASEATCEEPAVYKKYCEVCKILNEDETFTAGTVLGHEYYLDSETECEWAEDGSECKFNLVCGRDENHTLQVSADITSEVWKEPTCAEMGITTYIATYTTENEETIFTSRDFQDIPVTDQHTFIAEVNEELEGQLVSEATCEEPAVYKKYCEVCKILNEDETFTVGNAFGHTYGPAAFTWAEDGSSCKATFFCNRYGCSEKLESNCVITSVERVAPTVFEKGTTRYSAKVVYDGRTYKSNKDIVDIATKTLGKVEGLAAQVSADEIALTWDRLEDATGYILEKKDGTVWSRVAKLSGGDTLSYTLTGISVGEFYSFRIRGYAYESGKTVNGSNSATLNVATKLSPVTGVTKAGSTVNAIRLTWNKNEAVEGYQIEQLMEDGTWKMIKKIVGADTTEYRISNLTAGTVYSFRIRGYLVGTSKAYSDYTEITVGTKLPAMAGVKVAGRAATAVRLSWEKNEGAEGYQIEKLVDGKWKLYKKIASADTLEYRITGLTTATEYSFRVRAYKVTDAGVTYSDYVTLNTTTK